METKVEGLFTNTRLMAAGIILGVLGAILAVVVINSRIKAATGGTVEVYFLKRDLPTNETLRDDSVEVQALPANLARQAGKMVLNGQLDTVKYRRPIRKLEAGEPLLNNDFNSSADTDIPSPPPGQVGKTVTVEAKTNPGMMLNVGAIVALTGNFDFSDDRRHDPHTLRLLDRVQVVAINGSPKPLDSDRKNIRNVMVFVGASNAQVLKTLESYQVGSFDVDWLGSSARVADPRDQIPPDVLKLVLDKLKAVKQQVPADVGAP
jgi:hypothetical protein